MSLILLSLRLYFTAVLALSTVTKLRDLPALELTLIRLFGLKRFSIGLYTSKSAGLALTFFEGILTVCIATNALGWVGGALLAATMGAFTVVVARAFRLHVSCGCFRDRRPAELGSLTRSGMLFMLSVVVLIAELDGVGGSSEWASGIAVALAVAALVGGVAFGMKRLADRSEPVSDARMAVYLAALPKDLILLFQLSKQSKVGDENWIEVVQLSKALGVPVSTLLIRIEE